MCESSLVFRDYACVCVSLSVVWEGKRGGMKITSNWTDRGTHAGIRVKKKG